MYSSWAVCILPRLLSYEDLSKVAKKQGVTHLIVADLGLLSIKASSPKNCPVSLNATSLNSVKKLSFVKAYTTVLIYSL